MAAARAAAAPLDLEADVAARAADENARITRKGFYVPSEGVGSFMQSVSQARDAGSYIPARPLREQLLLDGATLTTGARNRSYGDPVQNFAVTAAFKALFWDAMRASGKDVQQNSEFGHSIDMVLVNLARVATSPSTHLERDRFLDGATYMAIAYEVGKLLEAAPDRLS